MTWIKHIFAFLLAVAMLFMGAQKFGAENIIFQTIAQNSGIPVFEPVIRMLTGVLEVVAGLLMLLPRTRGFAAAFATGIVAGAIVFHLSPWLGVMVAMEPGAEPTSQLFMMALAIFALAFINLILNWKAVPIVGGLFSAKK